MDTFTFTCGAACSRKQSQKESEMIARMSGRKRGERERERARASVKETDRERREERKININGKTRGGEREGARTRVGGMQRATGGWEGGGRTRNRKRETRIMSEPKMVREINTKDKQTHGYTDTGTQR